MTETTAVNTPRGAIANMIQSNTDVLSARYCRVTCSPKSCKIGARSVARLFEKSSHPPAACVERNSVAHTRKSLVAIMSYLRGVVQRPSRSTVSFSDNAGDLAKEAHFIQL